MINIVNKGVDLNIPGNTMTMLIIQRKSLLEGPVIVRKYLGLATIRYSLINSWSPLHF